MGSGQLRIVLYCIVLYYSVEATLNNGVSDAASAENVVN